MSAERSRRPRREPTLRQKTAAFLHAFCLTAFVLVCLITLLLLIAQADTATRAVGFGDDSPAFFARNDGEEITLHYFGVETTLSLTKIKEAGERLRVFAHMLLPAGIRTAWEALF